MSAFQFVVAFSLFLLGRLYCCCTLLIMSLYDKGISPSTPTRLPFPLKILLLRDCSCTWHVETCHPLPVTLLEQMMPLPKLLQKRLEIESRCVKVRPVTPQLCYRNAMIKIHIALSNGPTISVMWPLDFNYLQGGNCQTYPAARNKYKKQFLQTAQMRCRPRRYSPWS